MKPKFIKFLLLTAVLALCTVGPVSATVGGPSFIEDLSFDRVEKVVYYLVRAYDGRGCPPIVWKINFATNEQAEVKSCDELIFEEYSDEDYSRYIEETFRHPQTEGLRLISLEENRIFVEVEVVGEEVLDGELASKSFRARIVQNGLEVGNVEFSGCYEDQPIVFQGYLVPEINKLLLSISRIGSCFEGGYVKDDIFFVDGVSIQNTDPIYVANQFSGPKVLRGGLVAYALTGPVDEGVVVEDKTSKFLDSRYIYAFSVLILGVVIGVGVGYKFNSRRRMKSIDIHN